jgi:ABC-type transport system substrate-binding protein
VNDKPCPAGPTIDLMAVLLRTIVGTSGLLFLVVGACQVAPDQSPSSSPDIQAGTEPVATFGDTGNGALPGNSDPRQSAGTISGDLAPRVGDDRKIETDDILVLANRGDPPAGFDTLRTSSIALHHVAGSLFGPGNLVRRCRENIYLICPDLAERWVVNSGSTEWTFTIRDGVSWHDGEPFTAEDAKFWFDLAQFGAEVDGKIRAPAYFKGELGDIERVDVLSNNRVRVTLAERNVHYLDILANPRLKIAHPEHLMGPRLEEGDMSVSPLDIGLVGTGPFVFDSYERGSRISVRRWDGYWERDADRAPLPRLGGVDFVIMPDPIAMDVAFRTGRLDGGARGQGHYLTVERQRGYERDLSGEVIFGEMEGGMFRLAFNTLKEGPWQDARVRRAISLWIDKESAIPAALGGYAWTAPNLGPPNPFKGARFINWPRFDPEPLATKRAVALDLLASAGYEQGFEMGHLCRSRLIAQCEYLQAQLSGLNIDLKLQMADSAEWNRGRVSLDYDSQEGALTSSLIPEGTESVFGIYSRNPDATIDSDRVVTWRELEHYVYVEQSYIVPVAEIIQVIPYRSYVRGLFIPPEDGHTHTDFATVWLER